MTTDEISIGSTLYIRDVNRRVYEHDDGAKSRYPNPRFYWLPLRVVDQTRDSWLLEHGVKVSKKTLEIRGEPKPGWDHCAYTAQGKADRLWLE